MLICIIKQNEYKLKCYVRQCLVLDICTCTHTYMYICTYIYMCVHIHRYMHVHGYKYICQQQKLQQKSFSTNTFGGMCLAFINQDSHVGQYFPWGERCDGQRCPSPMRGTGLEGKGYVSVLREVLQEHRSK